MQSNTAAMHVGLHCTFSLLRSAPKVSLVELCPAERGASNQVSGTLQRYKTLQQSTRPGSDGQQQPQDKLQSPNLQHLT